MATKYWNPKAADIPDVWTITVADTWAAADTVEVVVGATKGVTITLASGWTSDTDNIAAEIAAALVGANKRDGVGAAYSWTNGGLEYGEFHDIENVSVSGSVVTIEGPPGVPITVSGTATTAGDGDITVAHPQTATGRRFWDDGDNWGGSVPVDDDDIILAETDIGPQYGLPGSTFAPDSVTFDMSFTGLLGLPDINRRNVNHPYQEYRTKAASFGDDGSTSNTCTVTVGRGGGQGSAMLRIDGTTVNGASYLFYNIINTGRPINGVSEYAVVLNNSTNSTGSSFNMSGGSVKIETADIVDIVANSSTAQASLYIGEGVAVVGGGGGVTSHGANIVFEQGNSLTLTQYAGTASFSGDVPGGIYVYGGTVFVIDPGFSQTVTTLEIGSTGILDCTRCLRGFTVTNASVYGNGELHDPTGRITFTNGVDLFRTGLAQATIDIGQHFTVSKSSI